MRRILLACIMQYDWFPKFWSEESFVLPPTYSRIFSQLSALRASAPDWMLVSWKALGTRRSSSVGYFTFSLKLASILDLPPLIIV